MIWPAAVLSGVLMAAAFPPLAWWPLAWVAWVPLLWAVRRAASPVEAGRLGFLAGLGFYIPALSWMWRVQFLIGVLAWLVLALFLDGTCWLVKRFEMRRQPSEWAWALAAAATWTGVEFFRCELWPLKFGQMALGYSQVGSEVLRQWGAAGGVFGLSFALVLVNALLAGAVGSWRRPGRAAALVVAAGALVGGLWGTGRGRIPPPETGTMPVGLVQNESPDTDLHLGLTKGLAAHHPKFVVWPEYSTILMHDTARTTPVRLSQLAKEMDVSLVVGALSFLGVGKGKRFENHTMVFGASGESLGRYAKCHPIPFIEVFIKGGRDAHVISTPEAVIGTPICFDMDFTDVTRRMAARGAEVLLTPNMDPVFWGRVEHRQRLDIARMRAIETRRWVVRAASSGVSAVIDPYGRITASLDSGEVGALAGAVSLRRDRSLYVRGGWLLAWVALVFTLGLPFLRARKDPAAATSS